MILKLKKSFYLLLGLNLICIISMLWWVQPISIRDILQLETSRNYFEANQIIRYWKDQNILDKAEIFFILKLMYVPFYMTLICSAIFYITLPTKNEILIKAAKFFSILLMVAGLCDVIEIFSLLHLMKNGINEWNLHLSYDMASTKFSIFLVTLLKWFIGAMFNLLERIIPEKKNNYFNSKP